jgi:hypothetical protein
MKRRNRDAIRRAHRPVGTRRRYAVDSEAYPCAAIQLLDDLEAVEAAARTQFEEAAALRRRVEELEAKIRRAVGELTS